MKKKYVGGLYFGGLAVRARLLNLYLARAAWGRAGESRAGVCVDAFHASEREGTTEGKAVTSFEVAYHSHHEQHPRACSGGDSFAFRR